MYFLEAKMIQYINYHFFLPFMQSVSKVHHILRAHKLKHYSMHYQNYLLTVKMFRKHALVTLESHISMIYHFKFYEQKNLALSIERILEEK